MSRKNRKQDKWQKPGGPPGGMKPQTIPERSATDAAPATPAIPADATTSEHDELGQVSENALLVLAHEMICSTKDGLMDQAAAPTSLESTPASTESSTPPMGSNSKDELISAIRDLRRTKTEYELAARRYHDERAAVDSHRAEVVRREMALEGRVQALADAEHDLAIRSKAMEDRRAELVKIEAQAEAAFPERYNDWRSLEEVKQGQRREALNEGLESLQADRDQLDREKADFREAHRKLHSDRAALDAEKEFIADKVAIARESAEAQFEVRHSTLLEELDIRNDQINRYKQQLARAREQFESLKRQFDQSGGLSMPDLVEERQRLLARVEKLELELARKPGQESVEQLKRDADRAQALDAEVLRLQGQLHRKTSELDRMRIPVAELENSRVLVQNMQLQYKQLKEANETLQADVESKLTAAGDRQTFPEMSRMDKDPTLQTVVQTNSAGFDLRWLVDFTRRRMANRPTPLYYELETVRCFLAGLSMSRLHILQGISGTGKTSLPVAFAEALNGRSDKIAVQAGWRDRQDLLGYYNAFDKRYHETEFIKSLYRAQCPEWSDRVCLIILDEMNLSYIEQFGADLLAELESPHPDGAQLSLMEYLPPQPPALLREGKSIFIPENVWFIGTANRDETTKDFADKSYDRAHTMELPRHQSREALQAPQVGAPISTLALAKLFEDAKRTHRAHADAAVQFIDSLGEELRNSFDIGWGNRLERQIRDFVPIVVAAGGTRAEAIDHLIATKLLRKLEHRHNVRASDLKRLRKLLSEQALAKVSAPLGKCDAKLVGLIRERSSDEGEAS